MTGQEPLFLSADAAELLNWVRSMPDTIRDSGSREARPEQVPRITIRPGYLYQGWFYRGQWCWRHVYEKLGWDEDRTSSAQRELRANGFARENGYSGYELTERGWQLALPKPQVVPL